MHPISLFDHRLIQYSTVLIRISEWRIIDVLQQYLEIKMAKANSGETFPAAGLNLRSELISYQPSFTFLPPRFVVGVNSLGHEQMHVIRHIRSPDKR